MTPTDPRPAIEALDITLPELMADLRAKQAEQEAAEEFAVADAEDAFLQFHGWFEQWTPEEKALHDRLIAAVHAKFHPELAGGAA